MITYGGHAATTPDELFYCQQKPDAVSYFKHRGLCSRAWIRIRMVAVWQFAAWLDLFAFSPLCTCAPEYSLSVSTRKLSSLAVSALELGSFNFGAWQFERENWETFSGKLIETFFPAAAALTWRLFAVCRSCSRIGSWRGMEISTKVYVKTLRVSVFIVHIFRLGYNVWLGDANCWWPGTIIHIYTHPLTAAPSK